MAVKQSIINEARIAMYARILRCPVEDNPEDCPLKEVREMPLEERVAWIDSKSDTEIVELYQHHERCLAYKLANPAFLHQD
jgi:hypothetical protein